jgi:ubiquinone/menaquinone biosynthesis C-methylase UbiE
MTPRSSGVFEALEDEYRGMASWYDNFWADYLVETFQKPLGLVTTTLQSRKNTRNSITRGSSHQQSLVVADIGCGTGEFLKRVEERNLTTVSITLQGIEPSHEMLQEARRKSKTIQWKQATAENMPLADSSVDVVCSTSSFHFFRNKCKALQEMFRVLKCDNQIANDNNPSLIITDWCSDYLLVRLYHFMEHLWWDWWKGYQSKHNYPGPLRSRYMKQLVEEAGFSNVNVEIYSVRIFTFFFWGMQTVTASKHKK